MQAKQQGALFLLGFLTGSAILGAFALGQFLNIVEPESPIFRLLLTNLWSAETNPIRTFLCADSVRAISLCVAQGPSEDDKLLWTDLLWLFLLPGTLYGLIFLIIGNTKLLLQPLTVRFKR